MTSIKSSLPESASRASLRFLIPDASSKALANSPSLWMRSSDAMPSSQPKASRSMSATPGKRRRNVATARETLFPSNRKIEQIKLRSGYCNYFKRTVMKAAFYESYGSARDVLKIGDLSIPTPQPGEVLVRIHFSGINPSDCKRRQGLRDRPGYPRIITPNDGAGMIPAAGAGGA